MIVEYVKSGGIIKELFATMKADDFNRHLIPIKAGITYSISIDIGSKNTSIAIGDDTQKDVHYILQITRDSFDNTPQEFIDKSIRLFHFVLEHFKGITRVVFIESPVYIKYNHTRTNSYAILKAIKDRLVNISSQYLSTSQIITKPATTWKATLFRNAQIEAKLNKQNKGAVQIAVRKLYKKFLDSLALGEHINQDSCDAVGMLHYLYDFMPDSTGKLIITPNTPRKKTLSGGVIHLVSEQDKDSLVNHLQGNGYILKEFEYCTSLDIEENVSSILALTEPTSKILYTSTIENSISVMKYISLKTNINNTTPTSKYVLIGGWL